MLTKGRRGGSSKDRLAHSPRPGGCGGWFRRRSPTRMWRDAVKDPDERQQLVTFLQMGQTCQHGVSGGGVKCPDPIHRRQNGCTWVQIQLWSVWETHSHPARVFNAYWLGEVLFHCDAHLLSDRSCDQAAKNINHNNASHPTTGLS